MKVSIAFLFFITPWRYIRSIILYGGLTEWISTFIYYNKKRDDKFKLVLGSLKYYPHSERPKIATAAAEIINKKHYTLLEDQPLKVSGSFKATSFSNKRINNIIFEDLSIITPSIKNAFIYKLLKNVWISLKIIRKF